MNTIPIIAPNLEAQAGGQWINGAETKLGRFQQIIAYTDLVISEIEGNITGLPLPFTLYRDQYLPGRFTRIVTTSGTGLAVHVVL
jgi:hypothetical protein